MHLVLVNISSDKWSVHFIDGKLHSDARQDCGGAADASLESPSAGAATAALESGKDAFRGLVSVSG
jgi:hypothetical protein